MAAAVGGVYWRTGTDTGGIQDRLGSLFFVVMYLSLSGLSSLPVWRHDRLLFMRERAAGADNRHAVISYKWPGLFTHVCTVLCATILSGQSH